MAVRFVINQYSVVGDYHRLYINDSEFSGTRIEIDGSFILKYADVDYKDPLYPIIESNVEISVNVRQEDTEFEQFLTELVGSDELRFTVEIYRGDDIKWKGHLPGDTLEIPDQYYTYTVNLTALDGLERLKNKEYKDLNGNFFSGFAPLNKHFANIFLNTGFEYHPNAPIFKSYGFAWMEKDQVSNNSVIDYQRVNHSVFQSYSKYPELVSENCYDVLKQLLLAFNARCFYQDDCFIIQQITPFSSSYISSWKPDGTLIESVAYNRQFNVSDKRTDGRFRYFPAIQEASTEFTYKYSINKNNLLPPVMPVDEQVSIGNFSGSDNHFIVKLRIRSNFNFEPIASCSAVYSVGISVGNTISLAGRYSQFFGNIAPEWQPGLNHFYVFSPPVSEPYSGNFIDLEFITPAFDASGEAFVYINLMGLYQTPDTPYPGAFPDFYFQIVNFNITQLQGETQGTSGSIKYRGINMKTDDVTPVNSTQITKLDNVIIGDGPDGNSISKIQVFTNVGWTDSKLWKPFAAYIGDSLPLHKLRVREYIAMLKTTAKVFEFTLQDHCKPLNSLLFEGVQYLILSYQFDPENNYCELTTLQLNVNRNNIQVLEEVEANESNSGGGGGGGISNEYNYWDKEDTVLSPKGGEDINLNGRYLEGKLKTDDLEVKSDGEINFSSRAIRFGANVNGLFAKIGSVFNKIWHQGNDGHTSGLDADTLDGKHATAFPELVDGLIPSSYLPSYVDDVLEYDSLSNFPSTGVAGKIYVAKDTNLTYRWASTSYVEISKSLALGETSATAYRGDRGKTAYDHSQTPHVAINHNHDDRYYTETESDRKYTPIGHVGSNGSAHANATTSVAGFMSAADKIKVDNMGAADNYEAWKVGLNTSLPVDIPSKNALSGYTGGLVFKSGNNISLIGSAIQGNRFQIEVSATGGGSSAINNTHNTTILENDFPLVKNAWRDILTSTIDEPGTYLIAAKIFVNITGNTSSFYRIVVGTSPIAFTCVNPLSSGATHNNSYMYAFYEHKVGFGTYLYLQGLTIYDNISVIASLAMPGIGNGTAINLTNLSFIKLT